MTLFLLHAVWGCSSLLRSVFLSVLSKLFSGVNHGSCTYQTLLHWWEELGGGLGGGELQRMQEKLKERKQSKRDTTRKERVWEKNLLKREAATSRRFYGVSFSVVATKTNFLHVGILKSNLRVEKKRGWEQVVWEEKGVEKERLGKTMTYPYYFFSILPPIQYDTHAPSLL